jgi:hypothetical protein
MAAMSFLRRALVALVLAVSASASASAQDSVRLVEQDIKAGLLYNFLRYTQWPPAPVRNAPMVVCLYGGDPFNGRLSPMAGRTVNQRPIELLMIDTQPQLERCSLVFINAEQRADWPRLRPYLARRSILTVSDYEGFAREGGMLEFTRVNERVAVRVNVEAARAVNLTVEERLLRLASIVRTQTR